MSELEQLSGHMQSFELLGGKYQQGELIAPGVIQTFRSYEVPTGRPVFIHRIPMDQAAGQDLAELLSAGLIRSSTVRGMIVDLYETGPYRFVVTEPARQCVPLIDWLEREAGEPPKEGYASEPAPNLKAPPESAVNVKPDDSSDTEFARLFQEALAGKTLRVAKSQPAAEPTAPSAPATLEPAQGSAAPPQSAAIPPTVELPSRELPASTPASQLFTPILPPTGRSNLVIFLVVLGVVVVVMAMGVVLFLKK